MALAEPEKPRKRAKSSLPRGTLLNHGREQIDAMKVGDVAEFDAYPGATLDELRGSLGAYGSHLWGTGGCTTTINRKTQKVEILRMA